MTPTMGPPSLAFSQRLGRAGQAAAAAPVGLIRKHPCRDGRLVSYSWVYELWSILMVNNH